MKTGCRGLLDLFVDKTTTVVIMLAPTVYNCRRACILRTAFTAPPMIRKATAFEGATTPKMHSLRRAYQYIMLCD